MSYVLQLFPDAVPSRTLRTLAAPVADCFLENFDRPVCFYFIVTRRCVSVAQVYCRVLGEIVELRDTRAC